MSNKVLFTLMFIVASVFSLIAGQYFGGYIFLKMNNIDLNVLNYDTLINYHELYKGSYGVDKEITKNLKLSYMGCFVVTFSPLIFTIAMFIAIREKEELHGSARFANDLELEKSGLLDEKPSKYPEILIGKVAEGKHRGKLIRFRGQQFLGLSAPTRSGKGVGVVIPNLVNYPDSVVNNDIKFENFRKTAGFRKSAGQEVYLFSPDGFTVTDNDRDLGLLRTHRWNPMTYIRRQEIFRIGDILAISSIFYPITGDKNDIWNELAGKLFKGLTLFMLDNEKFGMEVSFPQLLRLTTPEGGLDAWMKDQIEMHLCSEDCKAEFYSFMAAPNETKGSILSNLVSPLAIFSDKVCAAATCADDFDLREVRRKRISIYVGVQPTNTKKFSKLLNLFWSQLISENTRVQPEDDSSLKYQCLLMLDEFTSLGRVDIIQNSIGYTASYNMRYFLIYQSDAQLEDRKVYDKEGAKVLKDNLAVEIVYPPKKVTEHTKQLSETLGYKTVKHKSRSRSRSMGNPTSTTDADREDKRALMLPQEIVELGYEKYMGVGLKELIIMENMRPFKANKIIYFDEPAFMDRVDFALNNVPEIPLLDLSRHIPISLVDGVVIPEAETESIEGESSIQQVNPTVERENEVVSPKPKNESFNPVVNTVVTAAIAHSVSNLVENSINESTIKSSQQETINEIDRVDIQCSNSAVVDIEPVEQNINCDGGAYDFQDDEELSSGFDDYGFDDDQPF
ncbi:type IV secretory system conjugative DNA transfer family protein [Vibrio vulnificus]